MSLPPPLLSARSRAARAWLADCHALHRAVMSGFPAVGSEAARAALGILYRVEPMTEPPSIPVLVQSKHEPHCLQSPQRRLAGDPAAHRRFSPASPNSALEG